MGPEGADGKGRQGTNAFPTQLRSEPQAELRKHRRDRMIRAEMVKGKKKEEKGISRIEETQGECCLPEAKGRTM